MGYLFVDAAYLRAELRDACQYIAGTPPGEISFEPAGKGYSKVFFYEAPPPPRKQEAQDAYRSRAEQWYEDTVVPIAELPCFHVTSGWTKRSRRRGPIQKTVDVALAVDMVTCVHRRIVQEITLLAGDADFVPAVEAAVAMGATVQILGAARSVARELRLAADTFAPLHPSLVQRMLSPSLSKGLFPAHQTGKQDVADQRILLNGVDPSGDECSLLRDSMGHFCATWPVESHGSANHYVRGKDQKAVMGFASYFFGVLWNETQPERPAV